MADDSSHEEDEHFEGPEGGHPEERPPHISEVFLPMTFSNLQPPMLYTCTLVCNQWCIHAMEALGKVREEVWAEVSCKYWGWAVMRDQENGVVIHSWKEWYTQWKSQFNDVRSGWVQLHSKKGPLLLWMNTQNTGLALYKQYKEERFLFINLEKGLEVSRVEKKGKPNLTQISTKDAKYLFSCTKPHERDAWVKTIEEMIVTFNPATGKEEPLDHDSMRRKKTATGKNLLRSFTARGSVATPPKPASPVERVSHVHHDEMKKQTSLGKEKMSNIKEMISRQMKTKPENAKSSETKKPEKEETPEGMNQLPEEGNDSPSPPSSPTQSSSPLPTPEATPAVELLDKNFSLESAIDEGARQPDIIYKIIIIGNSGVGKTNLLGRWMTDKFENRSATISADVSFKTFLVNEKIVKVQFWDTAGQEAHFSLTQSYFRKTSGAIVVYDVGQASTFFDVQKWIKAVKETDGNENTQFLLVGNKSDLVNQREVTTAMGIELSRREHLNFIETSALNGNNVHKAFQIILQDIHKISEKFVEVESQVSSFLSNVNSITLNLPTDAPSDFECCSNISISSIFS
eukprot:TRINITY_DN4456_c0_g1_i1.p1 TRINITY_DN4456_c0_g1~~TRINITY_DN4456_c0_g1_i1.p1  ORF type:complete len:572 (-),score=156.49 TRINITY_DN4456_c0_g1_i1:38-1753(-)